MSSRALAVSSVSTRSRMRAAWPGSIARLADAMNFAATASGSIARSPAPLLTRT